MYIYENKLHCKDYSDCTYIKYIVSDKPLNFSAFNLKERYFNLFESNSDKNIKIHLDMVENKYTHLYTIDNAKFYGKL